MRTIYVLYNLVCFLIVNTVTQTGLNYEGEYETVLLVDEPLSEFLINSFSFAFLHYVFRLASLMAVKYELPPSLTPRQLTQNSRKSHEIVPHYYMQTSQPCRVNTIIIPIL